MNNYVEILAGREPIACYDNEFKGRKLFHIRKMWDDGSGELQPGKGRAVPLAQKEALLQAIAQYANQGMVKLKIAK